MHHIKSFYETNRIRFFSGVVSLFLIPALIYLGFTYVTESTQAAQSAGLSFVLKDQNGTSFKTDGSGKVVLKEGDKIALDVILTTTNAAIEMALMTVDYPADVLSIGYSSTPLSQNQGTTELHQTTQAVCGSNPSKKDDLSNYLSEMWLSGVEVDQAAEKPVGSVRVICAAGPQTSPFVPAKPVPKNRIVKIATLYFTVDKPTVSSELEFRVNSFNLKASPTVLTALGCYQEAQACQGNPTCIAAIQACENNVQVNQVEKLVFTTNQSTSPSPTVPLSIVPTDPVISISPGTEAIRLFPTDDTFIHSDEENRNFGSTAELEVDGSPKKDILLQFDTGSLDRTAITSARAVFRVTNKSTDPSTVKFSDIISWNEKTVTYQNKPDLASGRIVSTITGNKVGSDVSLDVTDFIKNSASPRFTLIIEQNKSDGLDISSKEGTHKPYIDIQVAKSTAVIPQPSVVPQTLELLPIGDTHVVKERSARNYGKTTVMEIDGSPDTIAYMQFSPGDINLFSIQSATLTYYVTNKSTSTQNIRISNSLNWDEATMTYSNRPDSSQVPVVRTVNTNGKADMWVTVDLTDEIRLMKSGNFTIVLDQKGSDGLSINSRESSRPPKLTIEP